MLIVDDLRITLDGYPLHYHLSVTPGEIVAIQGVSGVGKTTLLNLIAGYLHPTSGDIVWQGSSLLSLPVEQRPVSMLFQDHNLFEHLTVMENLRLGFGVKPPEAELLSAAQELSITEQLSKKPAQLSGGQRQRVGLIRTLLRPEPLLLLDEPFAELDANTREIAGNWTRKTAKQHNKTVLLVTHQTEDVERVSDRRIELRYPES